MKTDIACPACNGVNTHLTSCSQYIPFITFGDSSLKDNDNPTLKAVDLNCCYTSGTLWEVQYNKERKKIQTAISEKLKRFENNLETIRETERLMDEIPLNVLRQFEDSLALMKQANEQMDKLINEWLPDAWWNE